jgi:hypothetical protein
MKLGMQAAAITAASSTMRSRISRTVFMFDFA